MTQELKRTRELKLAAKKERDSVSGVESSRQYDWAKAHEEHTTAQQRAEALSAQLEAVEKARGRHALPTACDLRKGATCQRPQLLQNSPA